MSESTKKKKIPHVRTHIGNIKYHAADINLLIRIMGRYTTTLHIFKIEQILVFLSNIFSNVETRYCRNK